MKSLLLLLALTACNKTAPESTTTVSPDLTVLLAADQARVGAVTDETALWGGVSAEAKRGDYKIYNNKVQFAIQAPREGSYYLPEGGTVIDADIIRPKGMAGQDMVDDWAGMAGLGRLLDAQKVEVVDNGVDSGTAILTASGYETPLALIEAAVEAQGLLIPDLGLKIEHTYILPADSWLMKVQTTVTATDQAATFTPGDTLFGAADVATWWGPLTGYAGIDNQDRDWSGYVGHNNEVAMGIFAPPGGQLATSGIDLLSSLLELAGGFGDSVTLAPGESTTYTRYYGVGPDLATLSDAWLDVSGTATDSLSGVVTAADGPVEGARVTVLVNNLPYTLANTQADGSWSAKVPAGANTRWVVDGRGSGLYWDLPAGAGHHSPYATASARNLTLDSLANGAPATVVAEGRGIAVDSNTLLEPARLTVIESSGLPFEARIQFIDADLPVDTAAVRPRANGFAAAGWTTDGDLTLLVEPGTYELVVHHGPRHERHVSEVELVAGATELLVSLPEVVQHAEWIFGDPHCHASPSPDGRISMEQRMVNQVGVGVQLHFGTDHDHIADYNPLLEPLGIDQQIASVVAMEMSPVARGHKNLYPIENTTGPNGGAWPWFREPVATTDEEFAKIRAKHSGPLTETSGFVIQINHPTGIGMFDFAGWSEGVIGNPDFYGQDYNAIEVLNGNHTGGYLEIYFDLINRGVPVTPTGVTDSHKPFSGSPGLNGTYIGMGTDNPNDYTDDALREAFVAGRTIASRGLFLDMDLDPGSTQVGSQALTVTAIGSSWAQPDRLQLWRDGVLIETVESDTATFQLAPDQDASYVVMAEGDVSMAPLWDVTPWALANAIKIDLDGDGWQPPLPPLVFEQE